MFVIKLRKTFLFFNVKSSCDHGYLLSKDELKISNRLYKIFNLITVLPKVEYPLEEKTQKKKKNNRNNEQCEAFTIVCAILLIHRTHFRFFRVFGLVCFVFWNTFWLYFVVAVDWLRFSNQFHQFTLSFYFAFGFFFVRESPIVSNAIWLNLAWIWIRNVLSMWPISSSSKVSSISYKFLIGSVASFVLIIFILISYNILVIHIEDPSHEDPST